MKWRLVLTALPLLIHVNTCDTQSFSLTVICAAMHLSMSVHLTIHTWHRWVTPMLGSLGHQRTSGQLLCPWSELYCYWTFPHCERSKAVNINRYRKLTVSYNSITRLLWLLKLVQWQQAIYWNTMSADPIIKSVKWVEKRNCRLTKMEASSFCSNDSFMFFCFSACTAKWKMATQIFKNTF